MRRRLRLVRNEQLSAEHAIRLTERRSGGDSTSLGAALLVLLLVACGSWLIDRLIKGGKI